MDLDLSDFKELSAALGRASAAMVVAERAVVAKALTNIKTGARKNVSSHPTWKRLAHTINYDQTGLVGEVGYDDRGQGELAGIAEFGSARHAPHPALLPAAKDEAPRFEKATAEVAAGIVDTALTGAPLRSEYVTRDGRTILATAAQIANYTRGRR
jgi:hypothetical protein